MFVKELNIFPVKSCKGFSLQATTILSTGLPQDRRYMVVMEDGTFVTQRQFPAMALITTAMTPSGLVLHDPLRSRTLSVPLMPVGPTKTVTVWDDAVEAIDCGDEAANFFATALAGKSAAAEGLRLVCIKDQTPRIVKEKYAGGGQYPFGFADAFPFLLIGSASLNDLNARLAAEGKSPLLMNRFRTNFVIETKTPYEEDEKLGIRIGRDIAIKFLKPCSRCRITMTNQETAKLEAEPLAILGRYRKVAPGKILFGQNAALLSPSGATVSVGDSVTWL